MSKTFKQRLLQARNRGSIFNRLLYQIRTFSLWLKGRIEVVIAKWYFRKKIDKDKLKPDFLVAGMQKSATSWLDKMLRYHPDLYLPPHRKEVHFWDKFQGRGIQWYLYHFKDVKGHQLKGEVTPGYSILPLEEIKKVYALNPDLKVVFLLRNPIERAWSQIYMDLVRHPGRDISEVSEIEMLRHLKSQTVRKRGDYQQILKNWRSVFPENQLFIAYYEELKDSPRILLNRIFDFLDVPTCADFSAFPLNRKVNHNSSPAFPTALRKEANNYYAPVLTDLAKYLDHPIASRWLNEIS